MNQIAVLVIGSLVWQSCADVDCNIVGECTVGTLRLSDAGEGQEQEEGDYEMSASAAQFLQTSMVIEHVEIVEHWSVKLRTFLRAAFPAFSLQWVSALRQSVANMAAKVHRTSWLVFCSGMALTTLLVAVLWDSISRWQYWARFRSCENNIQKIIVASMNYYGETPLCPYCLQMLSSKPSPSVVVFHCGHRLHLRCVNRWLSTRPGTVIECPICNRANSPAELDEATGEIKTPLSTLANVDSCQCLHNDNDEDSAENVATVDHYRSVVLDTLRRKYPDIVNDMIAKRWESSHPQTWAAELEQPPYRSCFQRAKAVWACNSTP